ncbi:MAG: hypothetical protein ACT4OU_07550 [Hyphomicrobium sp.]
MTCRPTPRLAALAAGLALAGCASSSPDSETGGLSLPKMPTMSELTPAPAEPPVGSATELYARVARGANSCWFAANGPLKRGYIYNAEADAPSRGGKAEVTIHSRVAGQPNPRGPKAYFIRITPDGESAKVETENVSMTEQAATEMTSDVNRWANGEQGCVGKSTSAGWAPQNAEPPAPAKPEKKKAAKPAKKPAASATAQKTATP